MSLMTLTLNLPCYHLCLETVNHKIIHHVVLLFCYALTEKFQPL
jgi:hypothetical protein